MALIRWQPFQEVETLRRQMDHMFDELIGSERQSATSWQPAIELQDTEDNLMLRAEIPGVDGKDIDPWLAKPWLLVSIALRRRQEKASSAPSLLRQFPACDPLPVPIQNEQVKAEFRMDPDVDAAQGNGSSSHSRQTQPRR